MRLTRRSFVGKGLLGIAGVLALIKGQRPQEDKEHDLGVDTLDGQHYPLGGHYMNGHFYSPEDMKAITGGDWWDPVDGKHASRFLTYDELYPVGIIVSREAAWALDKAWGSTWRHCSLLGCKLMQRIA